MPMGCLLNSCSCTASPYCTAWPADLAAWWESVWLGSAARPGWELALLSSCVLQLRGLPCAACEDLAASSMLHCLRQSAWLLVSCCPTPPRVADHQAMPAANPAQCQHTQHGAPSLHSGSCWQLCGGAGPAHCGHRRASILKICRGAGPDSQQTKPRPGGDLCCQLCRAQIQHQLVSRSLTVRGLCYRLTSCC